MFTKETEYAIRALIYIYAQNKAGVRPGASEISEAIGAPQYYMSKILQNLVRHSVVNSQKGKGGGFSFEEDKDITLLEIVEITEGSSKLVSACVLGLKNCSDENPCPLHKQYAPIRESFRKLIASESIDSASKKIPYFLKNDSELK